MSSLDIVRAWEDEGYRRSLSASERSTLPANPAGMVELSDAELGDVTGGMNTAGTLCDIFLSMFSACCSSWSCAGDC